MLTDSPRPLSTPRQTSLSWAVSGLVAVWSMGATVFYVARVAQTVNAPFNAGLDKQWLTVWLVFVAIVLCCAKNRTQLVYPIFAAMLLTALILVVVSGQAAPFLLTLWLLALAWAWGGWLLTRLRASALAPLEAVSLALPPGLGLLSLIALGLTLAHLLTWAIVLVVLVSLTLVMAQRLVGGANGMANAWRRRAALQPEYTVLLAGIAYCALLNLTWALAPEIQADSMAYHLSVPHMYVEHGGHFDMPYMMHSYFVRTIDLLFTIPMALNALVSAKLLVYATGILAALSAYWLGHHLFGPRVGWWAAALFYTTPQVAWLSTTAYTDIPAAMYVVSSLMALAQWLEGRGRAWLWISAILVGMGIGVKPTAIYVLPFFGLGVIWGLLSDTHTSLTGRIRHIGVVGLGLCLVAAPAYALVFALTGNPFYSLVNRGAERLITLITGQGNGGLTLDVWLPVLARLPFNLTYQTSQYSETSPNAGMGVVWALLPLAVGLLWLRRASLTVLVIGFVIAFLGWAMGHGYIYSRYLMVLLPIACVLVVGTLLVVSPHAYLRFLSVGLLGASLVAQVGLTSVQFWQIPERYPLLYLTRLETADQFLTRTLPAYGATQFLNQVVQPGERIVAVRTESIRLYLDQPIAADWENSEFPPQAIGRDPTTTATLLWDKNYRYILASQHEVTLNARPLVKSDFLEMYTDLLYSDHGVNVYRLYDQPRRPVETTNLLANPSLEYLDASGLPEGWQAQGAPRVVREPGMAYAGQMAVAADLTNLLVQRASVVGGQFYRHRLMARIDQTSLPDSATEPQPTSLRLQVNWDSDSGYLDSSIVVAPLSQEWRMYELVAKAPDNATQAYIHLTPHNAPRVGQRVLFDAISFSQVGTP